MGGWGGELLQAKKKRGLYKKGSKPKNHAWSRGQHGQPVGSGHMRDGGGALTGCSIGEKGEKELVDTVLRERMS